MIWHNALRSNALRSVVQDLGNGSYNLHWRHFKNADKGGWVGPAQLVTTTPEVTGQTWQDIFDLWVTWGRDQWLQLANVDGHQISHTFLDMGGEPFQSSDYEIGTNMSMWMRPTLLQVVAESEHFTDFEIQRLSLFTVQAARFSYIQMMHSEFRTAGALSAEFIKARKEDLCKSMLTTMDEWDTYAQRRDQTDDMGETAAWLRENGWLA